MLCKKPYSEGVMEYGCGQCGPCRVNKARAWVGRILLESYEYPANSFVTLTFNEENVPEDGKLSKRTLQLFFKRLREEIAPRKVRYFAAGEYGEEGGRPHYHVILFGVAPTEHDVIVKAWSKPVGVNEDDEWEYMPLGHVHMGDVTSGSVSYVAGYLCKSKNKGCRCRKKYGRKWQNFECDNGKPHEFCLMSRKPAIGTGVVERYVKSFRSPGGERYLSRHKYFPKGIRTEGKMYPLGRVISSKVHDALGFTDKDREEAFEKLKVETYFKKERAVGTTFRNLADRQARVIYQGGKIKIMEEKRRKV